MSIVQDKHLREATSQWVAALDVLRNEMPASESRSLIREVFAAFLLLRWADLQDVEQEAMAVFEDRTYQPLLPGPLQWRHWGRLESPLAIADRLQELARHVERLRGDAAHPVAAYLHALTEPLRRVLKVNFVYLHDFVRWVADLPFETPSERRALLDVFDQAIAETGDPYDGQYATPVNIARLVAALANPQPGERVYDPCFGSGNFLVAAWQQAERSRNELRRPGALLEVAGIEINASAFLIGLTRMLLAGIEAPRLELGNSLERESLSSPSRQGFDVVLANPPIGAKTSREPWRYQHFAIATNDSTGLFIQHALSQLKAHGRAVIAVPEGFLFRGGAERELRRSLLEQGQVEAVIGLPAGAFAPYTSVKGSLLVLSKQGGTSRVRMVDAAPLFEQRSGRKAPLIHAAIAAQLADEVRRPELRKPRELPPGGAPEGEPGIGGLARSVWDVGMEQLAAADWDLSPRRREKGGLDELLASLKDVLGDSGLVAPLSTVAKVSAGRSIKSADLLDEPPFERAVGYVRIRDLSQGKVERTSSWLRPELASLEQRWALLPGDVLVSKSGTIGKAALVRNGAVGAVAANGLYVLRTDQDRLDAGYLLAYLASPACQNWLSAQSRGAVIQHLNRAVLNELPIPLAALPIQARAAAEFRDFGTDALTFLAQATDSSESDRLANWLADLDGKVPKFIGGLDDTPALAHFEPVAALASTSLRWLDQDQVSSQAARWLTPLTHTLLAMAGVAQIPPSPGLLNVLESAERAVQAVLIQTTGHRPAESQARAITERLREWLRAAIADLVDTVGLQVRTSPGSLEAGSFAEFSVEMENIGPLPLRNVRVETQPDWGIVEVPYLGGRGIFPIHLRGDVSKQGGDLSLRLLWRAGVLTGPMVEGEIELAIRVAEPEKAANSLPAELGGSPYVTGSPLEPMHGHSVFYGRDELLGKISRQIATHGNVVLLEGNRRAGKTSILKHLEGRSAIPGWLAVYASLQGAEGAAKVVGVPTAEVFREIARSIATALTKLGIDVPLPNGETFAAGKPPLGVARACREGIGAESPFADFREYLELVLSVLEPLGIGLVLMLDEFDKLQEGIDNGVTSPQVPENIRFLIQTYPKFSAILTGSRRLKRLREEYWSALYGLGTSIPVTVLDTESARKVVTEPVRDQLAFSQEAIERVIEVTARHPYLMQCLCNRVFDYAVQTKSRSITASVVNDAAHGLVRDNEHFASLWDYAALGPEAGRHRRQLILLLCARSFKQGTHIGFGTLHEQLAQVGVDVEDEPLDADLSYLRELELIEFSGEIGDGEYRLAIPLMADWIEQQQDADVVASRARTEAEEENA
ncbi:N-6 DNA methylase [Rhodoferax sediminis]|uniref:site-specific DNA-methyltransferase (adenine-specific) n=1 Tax=Rhodoferax sediminis TaxID=2509614 RepID=A0A515DG15_9BURK|nr:N-6 DNA methylase [Rhodoferax sediminis]QDL39327.1 restriction endonuclease subunit M [Rhodoferax sediminis]